MSDDELAVVPVITDAVICVFIHGFKGTDTTFVEFPERLRHILTETISNVSVECIVFPAYETKGNLTEAVVKFADWLTTLTVEKEVATGGGAGRVKIILCGHSMGGLLAADTLQEFVNGRGTTKDAVLWPRIIAVIAFDTPYLGLHPGVFKNTATKGLEYAQAARTVGTGLIAPAAPATGWGKWAGPASYVGGALLAGAAAGATYYKREDLGLGYTWATDHMKYVGHLWDADESNKRVDFLIDTDEEQGILFRNFYTFLPPTPLLRDSGRTFINLPKKNARVEPHFVEARNGLAVDELEAHTGMFSGKTNDGYYDLGLQTANIIREAVMSTRVPISDTKKPETPQPATEPAAELADSPPAKPSPPALVDLESPWASESSAAQTCRIVGVGSRMAVTRLRWLYYLMF
ncbi:hypothetical protein C8R46DRAFT_1323205 [Mycena filopes]|nr:hypothetical protein C8R46DRAFT_1323205 [Mycena filopes]